MIEKKLARMNHLVLFFDINGTIVALDTAQEKTIEVTLLQELAKRYTARWHESVPEPITYAKFVRRYLVQGDEKTNLLLKQQRQQKYAHFLAYLQQEHPEIHIKVHADFVNLRDMLLNNSGHLFPSFIKLLSKLRTHQIPFTLVLRSFGNDIPAVRDELKTHHIFINEIGNFEGKVLHIHGKQLQEPQHIIKTLIPGQHQAWQDDWPYWHIHKHTGEFGKPFYLSEQKPLSLFFDDKAVEKDIIHICRVDGKTMSKEKALSEGYLVPVDTLQAIQNPNYFCQHVFAMVKKHIQYNMS